MQKRICLHFFSSVNVLTFSCKSHTRFLTAILLFHILQRAILSKLFLLVHLTSLLFTMKKICLSNHQHTLFLQQYSEKTTEVVALFNFYTVLRSHCAKHRLKFHETRQTSSEKKNWRTLSRRDAIHWLFQCMYSLSKEFQELGLLLWVWLQNKKWP